MVTRQLWLVSVGSLALLVLAGIAIWLRRRHLANSSGSLSSKHSEETASDRLPTSVQSTATSGMEEIVKNTHFQAVAFSFGLIALIIVLAIGIYYFTVPTPGRPTYAGKSVETEFNKDVIDAIGQNGALLNGNAFREEWPAARSVHKVLAYMIARCRDIPVEKMTRQQFGSLLLDLRPDGGHSWVSEEALNPNATTTATPKEPKELEPFDQAILALSDSVARGRLAAVRGADIFYPAMIWLGWLTVVVSALATMFVTLKSSLSPESEPTPGSSKDTFWSHLRSFWLIAFGFLAIGFSTMTTILASAKQFWDPTAAFMRNEGALVALRQLHEQIVLDYVLSVDRSCHPTSNSEAKLARWVATLISLEPATLAAPVLIPIPPNNSSPLPSPGSDQGGTAVTTTSQSDNGSSVGDRFD
ncbi:MAG: hypothetical protein ACJ8AW_31380 [Rhodopila sp.]